MKKSIILAAGAAIAITGLSAADTSPVASEVLTSPILTNVKAGEPTRMIYELKAKARVLFIPATGRAFFDVKMSPDDYSIRSRVKVTGIADWFVNYDMHLNASGYTHNNRLRTYSYNSQNKDSKKNRKVNLTITPDDFTMEAVPRFGNLGFPPASTEQVLKTNDPITALITFALEPRAEGADPCGGPIKIFDGRQLTYLHLKNAGTKQIKSDAWKGEAIECHVTMDKIAGYDKDEQNDNLTAIDGPLRMFLAPLDNGAHVPVKIIADSKKLGKVTLQASKLSFEPLVEDE